MRHFIARLRKNIKNNQYGASVIEYALLVSLVAMVCIGAVTFVGNSLPNKLENAGSTLKA